MRIEALGYNPKTGYHNAVMTHTETVFLGCLWPEHVGRAYSMSGNDLAISFAEGMSGRDISQDPKIIEDVKRDVRHLQNHFLREHRKTPILSAAGNGGGYWIAESEEEAEAFYAAFRQRGLTGLVKASRGKQAVLVDMMQQLSFEFDDLLDASGVVLPPVMPRVKKGTLPVQLVDRFLEKMLSDPERFQDDLIRLQKKFGAVLFSKLQARALKQKVAELGDMLGGVEI